MKPANDNRSDDRAMNKSAIVEHLDVALTLARAMLTDGFFPLTPDTELLVKKAYEQARFKHLESLSV